MIKLQLSFEHVAVDGYKAADFVNFYIVYSLSDFISACSGVYLQFSEYIKISPAAKEK